MTAATLRPRWIAVGLACGLAVGALAFGVGLGDGAGPTVRPASRLTFDQLAGQRIIVGFSGPHLPASLRRMVRRGSVAGVILFSENLPDRAAARRLIDRLQAIPRPPGLRAPLLAMVDQEGGQVKRLDGAPSASARQMGARGPAYARAEGRRTGRNLSNVGVNVDLAPVLDVARPGSAIAEADRGFGSTPSRVSATAIPFAAAMQAAGVAATAKHFPGLGPAALSTDLAVQRVGLSKRALRRVDEAPYRRFVAMGGKLVMLSTAIYPAFSPKPAAFAHQIAVGELRRRLGFRGVSITDALGTVSVRAFGGPVRVGLAAVRAGTDLLLFIDFRAGARAHRGLVRGLRAATLDRRRFEAAAERVLRLRQAERFGSAHPSG